MDILQRNYYRLLRKGAFGEDEPLEPMSEYKWRKLHRIAEADSVSVYINNTYRTDLPIQEYDEPRGGKIGRIFEAEKHSIDTSLESLELLNIIYHNTDLTISRNMSLRSIIELGRFLRIKGSKVDFVKMESWLKKLGISNMAHLHGSVLISLFNFSLDELPFMHRHDKAAVEFATRDRKLTSRYLPKYPGSTIHGWMRTVYRTITQIEE